MVDYCFNPPHTVNSGSDVLLSGPRAAFIVRPDITVIGRFVEPGSDCEFKDYLLKEMPSGHTKTKKGKVNTLGFW